MMKQSLALPEKNYRLNSFAMALKPPRSLHVHLFSG